MKKARIKITVDDKGLREYYGIRKGRVCTVQSYKKYKSGIQYRILAPMLADTNSKGEIVEIMIRDTECELLTPLP